MHLAHLKLRNYRNYTHLNLAFEPGFHLLLGDNAQGKSNLLEAIYLLATLRSFRGSPNVQLIREGASGYFVGATVVGQSSQEIKLFWSPKERQIALNNRSIRSVSEFLGCFRAVIFSTEDLEIVKGSSRFRRRYLDLLLAQTHPTYLQTLLRYAGAVRSRNALLKQSLIDPMALDSFTHELVRLGNILMQIREATLPVIGKLAAEAHRRLVNGGEVFRMEYAPSVKGDFLVALAQVRERELALRMTVRGPHRDDLRLLLDERPATQFASEGQKRSLAIALKIAQTEYLASIHGTNPVMLLDDVMGELDATRRAALIPLLHTVRKGGGQVFMTCTDENWPAELGLPLHRWRIEKGAATLY